MPRKYYYGRRRRPSAGVVALNVFIITLLVIVILLLAIYIYIYFSGNNIVKDLGIEFPWVSAEVTEPKVIVPSAEADTTTDTASRVTTVSVTSGSSVTTVSDLTSSETVSETTVPKYSSTEYDKEFFGSSLFIGDSIFTGFAGFGYLQPENVFAQVGLNPESAVTKKINDVTAVEKAAAMQPDKICIMLGTNGLAYMGIDYMNKEMGELIDSLEEVCPDSEVIILSIPPVTEEHEKENPEKIPVIMEYNDKLAKTAEDKGCLFIDIFEMLQDENGYLAEEYAEADGLHFLGKAYGVVLSRIQYELENVEETDENAVPADGSVSSDISYDVTVPVSETEASDDAQTFSVQTDASETVNTVNILV